jgi:hypothetical protein
MDADHSDNENAPASVVGSLSIYTVRDVENFRGQVDEDDRYTGMDFTGREWGALFYDVLACPRMDAYVPGDDVDAYEEQYRVTFQQSLAEYPMLGRIWDMYIDVKYAPAEVEQLRDECQAIRGRTSNPIALGGLKKLITVCDEARRVKQGLFFASD